MDAASLANSRRREAVFRACGPPTFPIVCHLNAAGQFCIMRGQHVSQTLTQNKDHVARLIQHQLICHFAPLSLCWSVSDAAVAKGGGSSASVGSTAHGGDYIELCDVSNNYHWRCLLLVTFIRFFLTKIKCQLREQVLLSHHPSASSPSLCLLLFLFQIPSVAGTQSSSQLPDLSVN